LVKHLVFVLAFCAFLHASVLERTIIQFMGEVNYQSQRNLVRVLFADNAKYMNGPTPNTVEILKTLKDNGLLKLIYPEARAVELSFVSRENPLLFMRIVNESLQAMGYTFYLTKEMVRNDEGIVWVISMNTQHVVDPVLLSRQIETRGGTVETIAKDAAGQWRYVIDIAQARAKVDPYPLNTTVALGNPINPYWVNVSEADRMTLRAHAADRWFPRVAFFDKTLQLIEEIQEENSRGQLRLSVPENAEYARIEDRYTLDNIKRGLSLYLERR